VRRAVYPGSFDPVTNGHLEIIKRASMIFDELIVLVSVNPNKNTVFTSNERVELLKTACDGIPNVKITSYDGLIVDFIKRNNIDVIVKGLRAVTDFEAEFQMAHINKNLYQNAETVFLCADNETTYLSSSMVKQIASFGGDISAYVPESIKSQINNKISRRFHGLYKRI
jgi:pantetheine-phosphate adenylyltransferase